MTPRELAQALYRDLIVSAIREAVADPDARRRGDVISLPECEQKARRDLLRLRAALDLWHYSGEVRKALSSILAESVILGFDVPRPVQVAPRPE